MRHRLLTAASVIGISKNTVISELKKTPTEVNPYFIPQADGIEIEIKMDAEADEFMELCLLEAKIGIILAWHNGRRTDKSFALLMAKLSAFPATRYYTDDWQSYRKYIPPSEHIVEKLTLGWRIERISTSERISSI